MNNNLYRKLDDGTFELVSVEEMSEWDGYFSRQTPVGHTLVTVTKNGEKRKYSVDADAVALLAAASSLEDRLTKILMDARSPVTEKYTQEQLAAWTQLQKTGVKEVWFPSTHDAVEKFLQALVEHVKPVYELPWVRDTREKYLSALKLAMESAE